MKSHSHEHEHHEHHETHDHHVEPHGQNLEHAILKNLVELQKIHTDVAEKFDKLAKEISQMLALFELAARSFAKNAPTADIEKDKEFLEKIDKLLDQNKVLAKGLTLMEERLREKMYGFTPQAPTTPQMSQQSMPEKKSADDMSEFKPSIASNRPLPKF